MVWLPVVSSLPAMALQPPMSCFISHPDTPAIAVQLRMICASPAVAVKPSGFLGDTLMLKVSLLESGLLASLSVTV